MAYANQRIILRHVEILMEEIVLELPAQIQFPLNVNAIKSIKTVSIVENAVFIQLEVCGAILILPQNAKIRKNPRGILDIIIHLMLVKFRQKILWNNNK